MMYQYQAQPAMAHKTDVEMKDSKASSAKSKPKGRPGTKSAKKATPTAAASTSKPKSVKKTADPRVMPCRAGKKCDKDMYKEAVLG